MHGQGTYTFSDGRKYVGEWKDDKMDGQGTTGNISGAVAHGAGTVNLVDVTAFSGGTADDVMLYRFGVRGPANIRNRNQAYKVTAGKTSAT